MIEQLFRGLLRIDHDLNVVPELAQNMNVSADGLTYLFMLREDACWSDGHPLTAGDFVYAWRKLREEGHVTAFLLDDIESAEALDDWTLEVHLREPRNYFPYVLASHWSYPWPRHRADEVGAAWRRPESLVGNGPFVLAEVDETGALLTREPALARGRGQRRRGADRVHASAASEPPLDDWLAGATTSSSCATRRWRAPDTVAERSPTLSTTFLGFNAGHEPMADERVRRALAHAIDSAALVADSPGVDLAAGSGGAIPPVMPGHGDGAGLAVRPRARACAARRGRLSRAARAARAASSTRARGRPPAALAEQLAAHRRARRASRPSAKHLVARTRRHAWFAGWHADYPDPDGFYLGLLELGLPLYRDDETNECWPGARVSRDRDERLRLYREFERSGSASAPRSCRLLRAPARAAHAPTCRACGSTRWASFHLEQVVVDPPASQPDQLRIVNGRVELATVAVHVGGLRPRGRSWSFGNAGAVPVAREDVAVEARACWVVLAGSPGP